MDYIERARQAQQTHKQTHPVQLEIPMTYKIVRYHFKDDNEVIETGLSLEEAQEHCNREDSHGDGWFDGYTKEEE